MDLLLPVGMNTSMWCACDRLRHTGAPGWAKIAERTRQPNGLRSDCKLLRPEVKRISLAGNPPGDQVGPSRGRLVMDQRPADGCSVHSFKSAREAVKSKGAAFGQGLISLNQVFGLIAQPDRLRSTSSAWGVPVAIAAQCFPMQSNLHVLICSVFSPLPFTGLPNEF